MIGLESLEGPHEGLLGGPVDGRTADQVEADRRSFVDSGIGAALLQIWRVDLDPVTSSDEGDDLPALSDAEEARARRFVRARDAARYRRQHRVLRALLGQACRRDGSSIELHERAFGRPGAVGLGSLDFNLSRSEGTGWIALSAHGRVGIDGECLRPLPDLERLAAGQLSADEFAAWRSLPEVRRLTAFLRAWSRKEAVLKALGCGLGVAPALIEVGPGREGAGWAPLNAIPHALIEAGAELRSHPDAARDDPIIAGDWATLLTRVRVASLGGSEDAVAVAWLESEA